MSKQLGVCELEGQEKSLDSKYIFLNYLHQKENWSYGNRRDGWGGIWDHTLRNRVITLNFSLMQWEKKGWRGDSERMASEWEETIGGGGVESRAEGGGHSGKGEVAPGVSRTTQTPNTRDGGGKPVCSEYKRAGWGMWRRQRKAGLPEIRLCTRGMIREVDGGVDRFLFLFSSIFNCHGKEPLESERVEIWGTEGAWKAHVLE